MDVFCEHFADNVQDMDYVFSLSITVNHHIDGFVQERRNSIANALE